MLIFICEIIYSLLKINNTIKINSNNCKQFSVVKIRKIKPIRIRLLTSDSQHKNFFLTLSLKSLNLT